MKKSILKDFLARFSALDKLTGPYSVTLFYNRLTNLNFNYLHGYISRGFLFAALK